MVSYGTVDCTRCFQQMDNHGFTDCVSTRSRAARFESHVCKTYDVSRARKFHNRVCPVRSPNAPRALTAPAVSAARLNIAGCRRTLIYVYRGNVPILGKAPALCTSRSFGSVAAKFFDFYAATRFPFNFFPPREESRLASNTICIATTKEFPGRPCSVKRDAYSKQQQPLAGGVSGIWLSDPMEYARTDIAFLADIATSACAHAKSASADTGNGSR